MGIELRLPRYFAVVAEEVFVCFPRPWAPAPHVEPAPAEPDTTRSS